LLAAAGRNQLAQLRVVVGEVEKGRRGRELLALEEQDRLGAEQQRGRGEQIAPAVHQLAQPLAEGAIADLVVVLGAEQEAPVGLVGYLGTAWLAAPVTRLALVQEAAV